MQLTRHLLSGFKRSASTSSTSAAAVTAKIKPSTFTGKAEFYETLFFLDDVLLQLKDTQSSSASSAIPFTWLSRNQMKDKLGFQMSLLEYRQIRQRLNRIAPSAEASPSLNEFLRVFSVNTTSSNTTSSDTTSTTTTPNTEKGTTLDTIDQYGRVTSIGRRKSAVAKVSIIPTRLGAVSECLVNGRPAGEYFLRLRDMYRLVEPLRVVEQIGKFNIWAVSSGGGASGQSGAIQLALAKALSFYRPEWKEALQVAGLLKRDIRRVERKKPGQEKARKKFTWVKR